MSLCEIIGNRDVVLASADPGLRQRLRERLAGMRWQVREATGGAEALSLLEEHPSEALLMDDWLPDLEAGEFADQIAEMYPSLDVLRMDGDPLTPARSSRRNELLLALRELNQPSLADSLCREVSVATMGPSARPMAEPAAMRELPVQQITHRTGVVDILRNAHTAVSSRRASVPGLIGESEPMVELAKLIRLVAPRSSSVLIEGETGTGKEVVATALHRLSSRAAKPLTVLNCAAIPDGLLEAELFGHARGAFTGAVQARVGRIETAHGGTLFLDEIGEMPLGLQAKMLRFLECGEVQRVGDNEVVRVDVRVIAATHRDLEQCVVEGSFRLDLYHRLAVFPIEVPALRERMSDLYDLSCHLLHRMASDVPRRRLSAEALAALQQHHWPGNVRELAHVLERAAILASEAPEIGAEHIRYRRKPRV